MKPIPDLGYGVVDIHVHATPWEMMHPHILAQMGKDTARFELLRSTSRDPAVLLDLMDTAGIERAGIVNYVAPRLMGFTFEANRYSVEYVRDHRDRLFAHGSIDPLGSKDPDGELSLLLDEWGMAAIKIHPPHQEIAPNAYLNGNAVLPKIYEACSRRGVPIVFHTGTTIFRGARIKHGDPLWVDDVACDFPDLKIVLAHAGRPLWVETARYLVRRHPHVYLDLSSIPPQRIPGWFPDLTRIAGKVMWGSDWPGPGVPSLGANLESFLAAGHDSSSLRKILRDNAMKLFRLA